MGNGPANRLTVKAADGATITFSPKEATLSVYQTRRDELAVGDLVKITRNDASLDLANGERFKVARATRESITLSSAQRTVTLPAGKPLHVDHAYVTTVHSSQGLTENRVIYDIQTASRTTKRDVFYVAISRARHDAHIFTNSIKQLPAAISRPSIKGAALDLHRDALHVRQIAERTAARQIQRQDPSAQRTKDLEKEKS